MNRFRLVVSDDIQSFLAFALLMLNVSFYLQFDEQEDIEFRMPSRYSQSYDFDSTLDSPTVRSSTSTQPVDEDAVVADHGYEVKRTNCLPLPPSLCTLRSLKSLIEMNNYPCKVSQLTLAVLDFEHNITSFFNSENANHKKQKRKKKTPPDKGNREVILI